MEKVPLRFKDTHFCQKPSKDASRRANDGLQNVYTVLNMILFICCLGVAIVIDDVPKR